MQIPTATYPSKDPPRLYSLLLDFGLQIYELQECSGSGNWK